MLNVTVNISFETEKCCTMLLYCIFSLFIAEAKYEDDFEADDEDKDKRHIIGLGEDETRVQGKTISVDVAEKDKETEKEGTLPAHRRVGIIIVSS